MFSSEFCETSKNTFFTEHLYTNASENFENYNKPMETMIKSRAKIMVCEIS